MSAGASTSAKAPADRLAKVEAIHADPGVQLVIARRPKGDVVGAGPDEVGPNGAHRSHERARYCRSESFIAATISLCRKASDR